VTTFVGSIFLGAPVSFWVCKTLGKEWVERKIRGRKKFEYFLRAVRKYGFRIVFMFRLTPVPFGFQNGMFAISGISFHWYIIATWLGMLPEAVLWCYFGSSARKLMDVFAGRSEFGLAQRIIFFAQIGIALLLFIGLAIVGRRAMRSAMAEQEREDSSSEVASRTLQHAAETADAFHVLHAALQIQVGESSTLETADTVLQPDIQMPGPPDNLQVLNPSSPAMKLSATIPVQLNALDNELLSYVHSHESSVQSEL